MAIVPIEVWVDVRRGASRGGMPSPACVDLCCQSPTLKKEIPTYGNPPSKRAFNNGERVSTPEELCPQGRVFSLWAGRALRKAQGESEGDSDA
jgi:hypothetical protein